jgi:hypothetical protein
VPWETARGVETFTKNYQGRVPSPKLGMVIETRPYDDRDVAEMALKVIAASRGAQTITSVTFQLGTDSDGSYKFSVWTASGMVSSVMDASASWPGGSLPVAIEVKQHTWPEPQRLGQLANVHEGDVPLASLNPAQVAACNTAFKRQPLLRPADTLPQFGQPCAEQLAHIWLAVSTHAPNARHWAYSRPRSMSDNHPAGRTHEFSLGRLRFGAN